MKLHEYQAKSLIKKFGVPIQEGVVASTVEEAVEAAKGLYESGSVLSRQRIGRQDHFHTGLWPLRQLLLLCWRLRLPGWV
ncbi:MAG: ATP-grasp domain-containing protein, partial [Bacteroidota bacterium]